MASVDLPNDLPTPSGTGTTLKNATDLLAQMTWLEPTSTVPITSGLEFGRNIERSLRGLKVSSGVLSVNLRNQPAAVVMSIERYNEVIRLKEICAGLIAEQRRHQLQTLGDEFESLYLAMQAPQHRTATDDLFNASESDLNLSYRPGKTESAR